MLKPETKVSISLKQGLYLAAFLNQANEIALKKHKKEITITINPISIRIDVEDIAVM